MTTVCDVLVVGAGIAGASAAYFLCRQAHVVVLEREEAPGYHATGRSAALFTTTYGPPTIRALAAASLPFLESPPDGFGDHPLLTPRGALTFAGPGQEAALEAALAELRGAATPVRALDAGETLALCGVLRPEALIGAIHESEVFDLDVHAILQGYLRGLRAHGGRVVSGAELTALTRADGVWRAETRAGRFVAPVVVNAAGAWADAVARLAGVRPVGLVPKRRTAIAFDAPEGLDLAALPIVGDLDDRFYFKPESGRIMASPSDATPSPPCDAQAEEIDVAIAVDRIERATTMRVRRISHKWAGLRSFVADGVPVAGMAPGAPGFLWLAGQGGYGIKTSPALGRIAAALAAGEAWPEDIAALGVSAESLSPARLGAVAEP